MTALLGIDSPDPGAKRYHDGTHRVVEPEVTLRRVLPLARHLGVTRLANLTGLDRLGIPVAAAYRPNSRSLAVFQGKGTTLAAAKASALMEAAEAWHAERVASPRLRGRHGELVGRGVAALDPGRLPRSAGAAGEPGRFVFDWVRGRDLLTGAVRWVPLDVVTTDYTAGGSPKGPLQSTSHGLAAGNHVLEALCHALCEVIERDALALWRLLPDAAQDATALDLATAPPELRAGLLDRFAAAGVALRAFDVTSDVGVPVVLCLAVGDAEHDDVEPQLGSGCHPDPAVALARAAAEAAQTRLTRIAGARDDLPPESYEPARRAARARAGREWLGATPPAGAGRDCLGLPSCGGATLEEDLAAMLQRLAAVGLDEAVWVDLGDPALGLPVVRVVVPGLEGVATGPDACLPGARARERLRRLS